MPKKKTFILDDATNDMLVELKDALQEVLPGASEKDVVASLIRGAAKRRGPVVLSFGEPAEPEEKDAA